MYLVERETLSDEREGGRRERRSKSEKKNDL